MASALIVYASLTGNTLDTAEILAESFEKLHINTTVEECTMVYAEEFLKYDICVVATYTYGDNADLPEEIEDFYADLPKVDLSGKIFGVLGTGDSIYDQFCQSVDDFDQQFEKTKALRGAEMLKIDLDPEIEDVRRIEQFAKSIWEALNTVQNIA